MATMKLNADGTGTLTFNSTSYDCTGEKDFPYSKDITLTSSNCYLKKYSSEYNVYMEYAVGPIQWQRGAYIHYGDLSYSVGCVHLEFDAAKKFYEFVKGRSSTRLVTTYPW
mmetsp:Transcript_56933/g.94646  ORF Transcript_56933/g.94646 Transcript_56933/m.94646 type:complete len:111 (-) Transcript_56933:177-509(-)